MFKNKLGASLQTKKRDHGSLNHCTLRIFCELFIPQLRGFGPNRQNVKLQAPIFYSFNL